MTAHARLVWLVVFGIAFGWLEAAVVVYLRRLFYPDGFALPLVAFDPQLAATEIAREVATITMLVAVAGLAGRTRWQRFAAFLVGFGVWDLVYYLGLKVTLDWPASLADWDILFLLPWPWLGPVYAPAAVAALMVGFGIAIFRREEDRPRRADRWSWLLGAAGTIVLLWTWLRDLDASLHGALPLPYPLVPFSIGLALVIACGLRFLRQPR